MNLLGEIDPDSPDRESIRGNRTRFTSGSISPNGFRMLAGSVSPNKVGEITPGGRVDFPYLISYFSPFEG